MELYKGNKVLGKTKTSELEFKTETNYSELNTCNKMKGVFFEYSPNRKVLYMFPTNRVGINKVRWWSIEKNDIPELIKELQKYL